MRLSGMRKSKLLAVLHLPMERRVKIIMMICDFEVNTSFGLLLLWAA